MQPKSDHDLIVEIHTAIFGTNGQGGCQRKCDRVERDFYNFRTIILIILAGGGGTYGIVEAMKRLLAG